MSSSEIALSVRGLAKSYRIAEGRRRTTTLGEALVGRLRRPFARARGETFWALDDVSFDVRRGDVVGIIGRNGAGKSTLLKIISRITEPTRGEVALYGRVGSLLEVGTGFHAELTGRENIYLNGSILGMRRAEIVRRFDEIVAFAGVERFLDTPVKHYSSGMYVRLAFAVAAHLEPEILIIDEVLAVGDTGFQKRCLAKMGEVAQQGRTILFVSHQLSAVAGLCNKSIFLEAGKLRSTGPVHEVIHDYVESLSRQEGESPHKVRRAGSGELRFAAAATDKQAYKPGELIHLDFEVTRARSFHGKVAASFLVVSEREETVLHLDGRLVGHWVDADRLRPARMTIRGPWLKPGRYRVDAYLTTHAIIDKYEAAAFFTVLPILPYPYPTNDEAGMYGTVLADFEVNEGAPCNGTSQTSREAIAP